MNFGHVQVNDKRIKVIIISNGGKFPFDFQWKFQKEPYLTITPDKGTIAKGESLQCTLVYAPKKISEITDVKFACTITNGHKYVLGVNAKAFEPKLDFSFMQVDFGPCFLWKPGNPPVV